MIIFSHPYNPYFLAIERSTNPYNRNHEATKIQITINADSCRSDAGFFRRFFHQSLCFTTIYVCFAF